MEHIDLRKLNSGELKQVRRQDVRLKKMRKTGKEIEELTGVRYRKKMSDGSVSDYMRRWGLTCQRLIKRARKQDPSRI